MTSWRVAALLSALLTLGVLLASPWLASLSAPEQPVVPPEPVAPAARSSQPAPSVPVDSLEPVARAVVAATNGERRGKGLRELRPDPTLAELAEAHGRDMLERGYFDHVDPDGVGPGERVARGHRRLVGASRENLWWGSGVPQDDAEQLAAAIVAGWMGSQGHRENLLHPSLTHLGVGVVAAGGEVHAVQLLADVRGFVAPAVLDEMKAGAAPGWVVSSLAGGRAADRVDLFADGRPRWGPRPLRDLTLDAPPGQYQLRFYFPAGNRVVIANGPQLRVLP